MKLSIVAPAHNEEERIRPFLDAYTAYFSACRGLRVELIVVVNDSHDSTEQVVRSYAQAHPFVRLVVERDRVGKGGAVMLGFDAATGDLIGFVDADGATPPEAFMALVERAQCGGADVIIASRWLADSELTPRQPLSRRIASRLFNGTVRFLFGLRVTDTQCGAKIMSREAMAAVRPLIGITRWAFDVDLLFQLKRQGFGIEEIPTQWHDVSGSKVAIVSASLEMIVALCRLRLLYSPLSWVVTVYDVTLGRVFRS